MEERAARFFRWATGSRPGVDRVAVRVPRASEGLFRFLFLLLTLSLSPGVRAQVVLSELVAANATGLLDGDRHAVDWIELQNRGVEPASLEGWYLTDSRAQPTKWRFPAVTLAPGEFSIVFASGKDRTNPAAALHTNFKLSAGGEYLALVASDGRTVASSFEPAYPAQSPDLAYGAGGGEGGLREGYLMPPTPGATNGPGLGPPALAPEFSPRGGTFVDPFDVTLVVTPVGAVAHYTLDGSLPTTNSPVYTSPIRVEGTRLLRARAFVPGLAPSPVAGAAFTRLGANVRALNSDLPLVVVNLFSRSLTESVRNPAYVAFREPDPVTGFASLSHMPTLESRGGMEIRGSSSAGFEKKSYALELQDESGLDRPAPVLGLPSDSDWVLYAPYTDKSLIRDVLAYELSRRIGRYAPRTRFVELYVNRGNTDLESADYQGIYVLVEKLKIADHRVAVAGMEPDDLLAPDISGGYLLKRDRFDGNDQVFTTTRGVELGIEDPKRTQIGTTQRTWIRTWLGEMERTLYGASWRDPANGYRKYLDPGSFIDHQLLVESAKNIDGYRLSTFWHKDRNGRLNMGPVWDYNLTFGNANYLDGWRTNGWYWQTVGDSGYTWLRRLFEDTDFRQEYADRWFEIRSGPFSNVALSGLVDDLAGQVRGAQARNFTRWRILGQYVWPNWYIAPTWQAEINWLKTWVTHRASWMDSQFIAPPVGSHPGGALTEPLTLTLQPRRGSLYYSTDGTDPRQRGGVLSAAAVAYSAPVSLLTNAHVVARSRSGTNWSAPFSAVYVFRTPRLAITEVMYRPARWPDPGTGPDDPSAREFIELRNVGDVVETLAGVRLSGAVEFRFPPDAGVLIPGERVVVVRSRPAWGLGDFRLAGEFSPELPDEGGTLNLAGPVGEPIQTLTYSPDWYRTTDGGGFSLTALDEGATGVSFGQPSNWRASLVVGGTPGRANTVDRGAPALEVVRSGVSQVEIRGVGSPGAAYVLQVCTNLAEARWLSVRKLVAPGGAGAGALIFQEPAPGADEARFYRVRTAVE
ncbi:MAG: CotH kinase family protein [Verrucomicrobiales bacterium]|nr:CotH kinase family protein [Verrucomicrobiales bacterium]